MFVYKFVDMPASHSFCLIKFGSALLTNCVWLEASSVCITQGTTTTRVASRGSVTQVGGWYTSV